ncbi:MAG: HAMP domain-containing protein, partial [bacterium]
MKFLRGVTPRLIGGTALATFVCVALTLLLATYRHHAHLIENQKAELRRVCETYYADMFPAVVEALSAEPGRRARAFQAVYANLNGLLPALTHFSIVRPLPGGELLAANGEGVGLLDPGLQAKLLASSPQFALVGGRGRLTIVYHAAVSRSWNARAPAAIVRIGVAAPAFGSFLYGRLRKDILWVLLVFAAALAVNALMIGWLTRSLRSVASYARAIERGEAPGGISVASTDEASTIAEAFNAVTDRLRQSYVSTLGALAALLESKDRTTETHSLRGVQYAMELGRSAGLSAKELLDLEYGALLHDIGKVGV